MAKKFVIVFAILGILLFAGCTKVDGVAYKYSKSDIYSKEDRHKAMEIITKEHNSWDVKVTLKSIKYAGDEKSTSNLDYCNELRDTNGKSTFTECIVFTSVFDTPKENSGSFNPGDIYEYTWYLAREQSGEWIPVTYGMA